MKKSNDSTNNPLTNPRLRRGLNVASVAAGAAVLGTAYVNTVGSDLPGFIDTFKASPKFEGDTTLAAKGYLSGIEDGQRLLAELKGEDIGDVQKAHMKIVSHKFDNYANSRYGYDTREGEWVSYKFSELSDADKIGIINSYVQENVSDILPSVESSAPLITKDGRPLYDEKGQLLTHKDCEKCYAGAMGPAGETWSETTVSAFNIEHPHRLQVVDFNTTLNARFEDGTLYDGPVYVDIKPSAITLEMAETIKYWLGFSDGIHGRDIVVENASFGATHSSDAAPTKYKKHVKIEPVTPVNIDGLVESSAPIVAEDGRSLFDNKGHAITHADYTMEGVSPMGGRGPWYEMQTAVFNPKYPDRLQVAGADSGPYANFKDGTSYDGPVFVRVDPEKMQTKGITHSVSSPTKWQDARHQETSQSSGSKGVGKS